MSPQRVKLSPTPAVLNARQEVLGIAADMVRCTGIPDDVLTPALQEVLRVHAIRIRNALDRMVFFEELGEEGNPVGENYGGDPEDGACPE